MVESELAPMHSWQVGPLDPEVMEALRRLRRAPDVRHLAVMPDVHLAEDVCVGVALGTGATIYPQAVGGDIGCGMLAVPFDIEAAGLAAPATAGRVLARLGESIPARRRVRRQLIPMPQELQEAGLSDPGLQRLWEDEGALEHATLGSGNHFIELQADEAGGLWLMVHSGSRALGPAVRDHHLRQAEPAGAGLKRLSAQEAAGAAYLQDARWARRYADSNRQSLARLVEEVVRSVCGGRLRWEEAIRTDHNHVERETHGGCELWVHRKGAMPAHEAASGVLPGSMGALSYHVCGRGCAAALCSSAHGAGRILSRSEARRRISEGQLHEQMRGVWYDHRKAARLRDEAPGAYKDIRAVARAQQELVKIERVLRPVVNFKGT
jgi:tRNA-splicing ligase RtcB (3'-phosphate/5'-hydroxy nucleic acid ligase)